MIESDIKKILILIKEIKDIAKNGMLPDGDEVNISTMLWAEIWVDIFNKKE